ncbi:MAG: ComEC family competence protein [Muribaculaceae bacterium]|nr:ComEC family competence protein [Muribaculaceae bacterium]
MAFGAALYFGLTREPHIPYFNIISIIIAALSGIGMTCLRRLHILRVMLIFIFGFTYASAFTYLVAPPQISRTISDRTIPATVSNIDYTPDKVRVFLRIASGDIGAAGRNNATVRVSIKPDTVTPNVGDKIMATLTLFAPSGADAPETFDYARWAYFNGITATGIMTDYSVVERETTYSVNALRARLHKGAKSFLADGLVLGYKNSLPDDARTIWTSIGIGHVWAISGFHIALVTGWLFAIFYSIFRLVGPITRRIPARIIAMGAVWFGITLYLMISGAAVATIRAFLMTTLVILALCLGRNAISLRNVCIVFIIVFLINPHYVMQAGFQLSFAAVFGLVWLFNVINPKMPTNKILKVIYVATLTSTVATIFTAPFVAAHFYNLPLYSLIGNLILLPIFSVMIMPLVMIGVLCSTVGIMTPINLAHIIYDKCLYVAEFIASLPGATPAIPHVPNSAICLFILGFIGLVFIRDIRIKISYIVFSVCSILAIGIVAFNPRPIFMTTVDHELVGYATDDNICFSKSRASNHFFAFDTWRQLRGLPTATQNQRCRHDDGIWRFDTATFNLVYIQKFVPLQHNIVNLCRDDSVDYIVSYFDIHAAHCDNKILRGGFVINESGKIIYTPSNRPWHNRRL